MFSCSSSQSYSLVHCSVLCQCHCLSTVSHSLFILLPLFIHLFPPHTPHPSLALFHNPDEKTGECALKIFRRGRRVFGREARRGDEEGRRAKGEAQKKKKTRKHDTTFPPSAKPTTRDEILRLVQNEAGEPLKTKGSRRRLRLGGLSNIAARESTYALHVRVHVRAVRLQSRGALFPAVADTLTLNISPGQRDAGRVKASERD